MPDNQIQPTILVKKSDGTTARMTLAEVEVMKKHKPHNAPHHTAHPNMHAKKQKVIPMTHALSSTAPVKDIFVDEARLRFAVPSKPDSVVKQKPKVWQKEDAESLLEDKTAANSAVVSKEDTSASATQVVDRVLQKAGWNVGEEVKKRLSSLIVSRIKDIRTDAQFLVNAMTPTHRGGVGLSPDQADQLLVAIQSILPSSLYKAAPGKPVSVLQNITAPVNPKQESIAQKPAEQKTQNITKPSTMDDIKQSPQSVKSMGPKEEFASLSLADFRRLGATTDAALSRLKEKFDTLKAESYLLFMEARDAWYLSPLYKEYIELIRRSLREKKKLQDALPQAGSKDGITMDVFKAVVAVNGYISV